MTQHWILCLIMATLGLQAKDLYNQKLQLIEKATALHIEKEYLGKTTLKKIDLLKKKIHRLEQKTTLSEKESIKLEKLKCLKMKLSFWSKYYQETQRSQAALQRYEKLCESPKRRRDLLKKEERSYLNSQQKRQQLRLIYKQACAEDFPANFHSQISSIYQELLNKYTKSIASK